MDEDDGDNDLDEDPILEYKTVPHFCGINRIRVSHVVLLLKHATAVVIMCL